MGIQQFKLQVSLRLGIALYFFASISCCKHASTINEVGSCTSNLDDSNPSSSALHGVNEFITEAYFEKHASLIDSDFQGFLSKEIPLEFCEVLQDKLEPVPKLSISHRHLIGEGSHRRLSSSIRLEIQPGSKSTLPAHFCDAIVVEILPSGVFADPFELQHLLQRGVFTGAAVFGDTNLELPSIRSNRSIVEIHMDIGPNVLSGNNNGLEINIEVPLHARYAPLGEHEFSRVEFSPPDLFTCCSFEGKSHKQSCIFLSTNKSLELKASAVVWDVPCGIKEHTGIGFRKVDPDRWEFANELFLRGQKHLLNKIIRKKTAHGHNPQPQQSYPQSSSVAACVEVGKFGLEEEVERLKRDKNVLMQELVRLRQQQQTTDNQLQAMVQRLQGMEQRQQQMMSFLAKAVNSPGFLAQFVQQQNENTRRITEGNKKRRLKQDGVVSDDHHSVGAADGQIVKYQPLMNEAAKAMLRQIMKLETTSRLENFDNNDADSFILSNLSSPTNARTSGVTLQEVPPTSVQSYLPPLPSMSEIGSSPLDANSEVVSTTRYTNPLAGVAPELPSVSLPATDVGMPELSQLGEMVLESNVSIASEGHMAPQTENNAFLDPTVLGIDGFSPGIEMEWDNNMLDEMQKLFGTGDPSWEQFLELSPMSQHGDTEEMDSTPLEDHAPQGNEGKPLENGWSNNTQLQQLTEQMGLLTSENKKV